MHKTIISRYIATRLFKIRHFSREIKSGKLPNSAEPLHFHEFFRQKKVVIFLLKLKVVNNADPSCFHEFFRPDFWIIFKIGCDDTLMKMWVIFTFLMI